MEKKSKINKFFLLNDEIIKDNCTYPFDIFKVNNELISFELNKNDELYFFDILRIKKINHSFYCKEEEYLYFLDLLEFLNKSKLIYKNTSKLINLFFSNKELLVTKKEIKTSVMKLIDIIYDSKFNIKCLFEILSEDYSDNTHSVNTALYSLFLAKEFNFDKTQLLQLGTAALLHDIGKSKISKKVVYKKEFLSSLEYEKMKNHALYAYEIALRMGIKDRKVLFAIRSHHEKIDGTGYPDGLKNKKISFFARIIAICDIFDSLITKKSYKDEISTFEAVLLIKKTMSNHLDMEIFETLVKKISNN